MGGPETGRERGGWTGLCVLAGPPQWVFTMNGSYPGVLNSKASETTVWERGGLGSGTEKKPTSILRRSHGGDLMSCFHSLVEFLRHLQVSVSGTEAFAGRMQPRVTDRVDGGRQKRNRFLRGFFLHCRFCNTSFCHPECYFGDG